MKYLIGFPMTLKNVTSNDREMPFYATIWYFLRRFEWTFLYGFRRQLRKRI